MTDTQQSTSYPTPARGHKSGARRLLWFLVIPIVLCIAGVFVYLARKRDAHTLVTDTNSNAAIPVTLMHAQPGDAVVHLDLPATLQAFEEAPLYPRVSGYVRTWYTDLGAHVRSGQVMAVIDSPETDHQLQRARATLGQAQSGQALAATTAKRYQDLIQDNSVAQQEVDQNNQNLAAQTQNVAANKADVAQLQQQQAYERVTAPFDGIVTRRTVSVGDLVNAGNSGAGAELFRVSRISTVRVFVSVPEVYSRQIAQGDDVTVVLVSAPDKPIHGRITRTDHAIDLTTRTLLVEVDVPNPTGVLLPGAYASVHFKLAAPTRPLMVPSGTILFQAAGPQVAVVDAANHVHLHKVSIGRDLGNTTEIVSGISPGDALIANPPDFLIDGMTVTPTQKSAGGE